MTLSISNLYYLLDTGLIIFILIAFGIFLVMFGHILKISERLIFITINLLLIISFVVSLNTNKIIYPTEIAGIAFDTLGQTGISILLLAFLGVIILAQVQVCEYDRKLSSILLLLISLLGAMLTAISHNWLLFFASTQCMSLPIYALLAYDTNNKTSLRNSVRYLVLSSVAMSFMLFGVMILYAAFGTLDFNEQGKLLVSLWPTSSLLILLGFVFILVGLGFKLSLFPFHFWTPKVYQGAQLFLVGHLAIITKCAVLIAFARAWFLLFSIEANIFTSILIIISIISMWLGACLMLFEQNFIRLLAYLSVSHLGFLFTALLAKNTLGLEAIFLDIIAFSLAVLVILAGLSLLPETKINKLFFTGLIKQHKLAASLIIFGLLSLIGLPLTAGFIGKYAVFSAVISAQRWEFLPHMILTSLISIISLVKYILAMFELNLTSPELTPRAQNYLIISLGITSMITAFVIGLYPEAPILWVRLLVMNTHNIF